MAVAVEVASAETKVLSPWAWASRAPARTGKRDLYDQSNKRICQYDLETRGAPKVRGSDEIRTGGGPWLGSVEMADGRGEQLTGRPPDILLLGANTERADEVCYSAELAYAIKPRRSRLRGSMGGGKEAEAGWNNFGPLPSARRSELGSSATFHSRVSDSL